MPAGIRSRHHLYYTQAMVAHTLAERPPDRAQGRMQDMQHRMGISIFAAIAAGLAALMLWSRAEAAEAEIRSFSFDCETPDGRIVKPLHGDIEGRHIHGPARAARAVPWHHRPQDRALLGEHPVRLRGREPEIRPTVCPGSATRRARALGTSRSSGPSGGAEDPFPVDDATSEQDDEVPLETTLGGRHRIKPVDRLMSAREAANMQDRPQPRLRHRGDGDESGEQSCT